MSNNKHLVKFNKIKLQCLPKIFRYVLVKICYVYKIDKVGAQRVDLSRLKTYLPQVKRKGQAESLVKHGSARCAGV